ncbi:MAG: 50S ribosomal protein L30 [uncultured bacterium]|nr:MAG: 50S ribosomal protein L30 [uncultured bacterium]OGT37169.1 MAG: 50S ribosomal protein L30 [Gammaproteobacteria bacterium RIFCSPHIGHO2_12_FULL_38_14]
MTNSKNKKLKITLIASRFGRKPNQADCVRALGLSRIRQSVFIEDTASIRGLINKVSFLVKVEEV